MPKTAVPYGGRRALARGGELTGVGIRRCCGLDVPDGAGVMGVAPTVVPEPGHARPAGTRTRSSGRSPSACRTCEGRSGAGWPCGCWARCWRRARARRRCSPPSCPWAPYHALRQRLREWLLDGADKAVPLRRAGRRRALLRALAALGAGLVAGARAGAGGRRHRPPRGRGGAGRERALPRQRHPGRLGGPARQRAGRVAGADPAPLAPAAPGRAAGLDGAGAGRPRPVEPAAVAAHPPARLAPAAAHPAADHDHARRSASAARPGPWSGPARPGSAAVGSAGRRAGA